MDAMVSRSAIGLMRIVVGLLWLANMEWKRPGDFGLDLQNGLYKYVDSAVRNPVFPPYSWFVENVVLKQYRLFGWITLLIEAALAACLLFGIRVRLAALVGAGLSVSIAMSVLYYDKIYEWPWSYYLMFAIHILLFAVGAGRHLGMDGLSRAGAAVHARAARVLGVIAIASGLLGLYVSRGQSFTAKRGEMFGWARGEMKYLWFNPLSAVLTIAFGIVALAASLGTPQPRQRLLMLVAAGGFALMSLQIIVQWRYNGGGANYTGGVLGSTGANLAWWGGLSASLAICAVRTTTRSTE
jgi:hypothetical protein